MDWAPDVWPAVARACAGGCGDRTGLAVRPLNGEPALQSNTILGPPATFFLTAGYKWITPQLVRCWDLPGFSSERNAYAA